MTDPRIEAAVSEWIRHIDKISIEKTGKPAKWNDAEILSNIRKAMTAALAAAAAAARARVVPFPIPDNRMETAKNTLLCWKGGALSDDDAIGMIVCGVSEPPASIDALGGVDG